MAVRKAGEKLKDACWKGYEAIGMKMQDGKKVPNCVPQQQKNMRAHPLPFLEWPQIALA